MRLLHLLVLLPALALLAACGATSTATAPREDFSSVLMAPAVGDFDETDETPDADDGLEQVTLDDGSTLQLWIDPTDIARVVAQHSDPDDPDAWTPPETIYTAGDGCLLMDASTNGTVVAVGLGCYATDAFIQQAPDQGVALVSTDLTTWESEDRLGEFSSDPVVADDGSVRFVNDVYPEQVLLWSAEDGFRAETRQ